MYLQKNRNFKHPKFPFKGQSRLRSRLLSVKLSFSQTYLCLVGIYLLISYVSAKCPKFLSAIGPIEIKVSEN